MSYSKFGEYVRILRIKHHEVMGDMAEFLGVSTPFLSAVENGKKNVPKEWKEVLSKHYDLNENEKAELEKAIEESKTQEKIVLKDSSEKQRVAAIEFARSFENISDETAEEIIRLLEGDKE